MVNAVFGIHVIANNAGYPVKRFFGNKRGINKFFDTGICYFVLYKVIERNQVVCFATAE